MTTVTQGEYVRHCTDPYEVWRAETMFTKEPGTIAWLSGLKAGETFFDIGANIGIYTDIASRQVGSTGRVYAFEPHVGNAASLMRHAVDAGLDNITLITSPLHCVSGMRPFFYASSRAGSSGSQFGHTRSETGEPFKSVFVEWKWSLTIDELMDGPLDRPARLVKIDVDGNELAIIDGMQKWLSGLTHREPPESVQVETRPSNRCNAIQHMKKFGNYCVDHVHYTSQGMQAIAKGADPDTLPNNTVFVKATA